MWRRYRDFPHAPKILQPEVKHFRGDSKTKCAIPELAFSEKVGTTSIGAVYKPLNILHVFFRCHGDGGRVFDREFARKARLLRRAGPYKFNLRSWAAYRARSAADATP